MQFQILNKNIPLTMEELDKEAAAFFGVEVTDEYAGPSEYPYVVNWFEMIGPSISRLPEGEHEWRYVIGNMCAIAATLKDSKESFLDSLVIYEPFIDLCFHWQSKGYIPVSC